MLKYIGKRIVAVIPVLFIVSLVVFFMIHLIPGDPARVILGDQALEEDVLALQEQMGLNDPIWLQYINWIVDIFHGDLGESLFIDAPMTTLIWEHLLPTLALSFNALVIAVIIAIPCGIFAAKNRGRAVDQILMGTSMLGISVPNFLIGLLLILLCAVKFNWFPSSGYKTLEDGIGIHFKYLFLPSLALGLMHAALITRMTRSSMLEVLGSDYIKMARAKGVKENVILFKHALKNALLPIITVIGQSLVSLLSGALVTESVFNIPGIGQLVVTSINRRDYEVIQAVILVIAIINVLVMLLIDILYGFSDSRIRMQDN